MSELIGSGIVAASAAGPYQGDDAKRGAWFSKTFDREMEEGRGFLWLPVCFGIGILVYFALPVEPSTVAVSGIAFGAAILAWTMRRRTDLFRLTIALTFVAGGAALRAAVSRSATQPVTTAVISRGSFGVKTRSVRSFIIAIAVTARLRPPNGPVIPGGYDFARAAPRRRKSRRRRSLRNKASASSCGLPRSKV